MPKTPPTLNPTYGLKHTHAHCYIKLSVCSKICGLYGGAQSQVGTHTHTHSNTTDLFCRRCRVIVVGWSGFRVAALSRVTVAKSETSFTYSLERLNAHSHSHTHTQHTADFWRERAGSARVLDHQYGGEVNAHAGTRRSTLEHTHTQTHRTTITALCARRCVRVHLRLEMNNTKHD